MKHITISRTPILYTVGGFLTGVIVSRNAAPMSGASKGAVALALVIAGFLTWRAGNKGKAEAVAVAVATAVATAQAEAKAEASASAQAIIQFYSNGDGSPERVYQPIEATPILELQDAEQAKEIDSERTGLATRSTGKRVRTQAQRG